MNYKDYGLKEALAPNIYVNKITLDYNKALMSFDYIGEASEDTPEGQAVEYEVQTFYSDGAPGLELKIQTSIIIKANDYEEFFSIISDSDFGDSLKINNYLFVRTASTIHTTTSIEDELLKSLLVKFNDEIGYQRILERIIKRSDIVQSQSDNLSSIVSAVVGTSQDESLLSKILFYQKQLPDGTIYYQIPYNITFKLDNITNPNDVHLFTFANVENFEIDMNFNFGDFTPDATINFDLELTDIPIGPLNLETIIVNGEVKNTGIIARISENQKTFSGENPPGAISNLQLTEINERDVLRENKFSSLANNVWVGGIHKSPVSNRYMAGSYHSSELHPYLDLVATSNSKLIDLRPLRDLDGLEISNLQSNLSNVKTTKTNFYSDNNKLNILEKLNVISDPLLSRRKDNNINAVFGVDYISFIRKHSVFSGLIDNFLGVAVDRSVSEQLGLSSVVRDSLKIKITRIDKEFGETKLVYDSSRVNGKGVFLDKPNVKTIGHSNNNITEIPLGYLNVMEMDKNLLSNLNQNFNAIEFYTFTDFDPDKKLNTEYHYMIDIEIIDPMFLFLENGLQLLNYAINGTPTGTTRTIGLKQFLNFVKTVRGKSSPNTGKEDFFTYVADSQKETAKTYSNKTLQELMQQYDLDSGINSFIEVPSPVGPSELQLSAIRALFASDFIKVLFPPAVFGKSQAGNLYNNISRILDLNNLSSLDVDYVQELIKVLSSLEYNLRQSINAISNVDVGNQTTGIGLTVSPINTSTNKRTITESNTSSTTKSIKEYGFNYLSSHKKESNGTKQIPYSEHINAIISMYSKYYDVSTLDNKPQQVQDYLSNYIHSYMFLEKDGVELPEAFESSDDSWDQLLQKLLLYKEDNISKMSQDTIFTYTQDGSSNFKFDVNSSVDTSNPQQFKLLKSVDRSQKQLVSKGMSLPDRIYEGDVLQGNKLFTSVDNSGQSEEGESSNSSTKEVNLLINQTTNYFLSYVNNAVENGNDNKSLYLNLDPAKFALNLDDESNTLDGTTLPVLSLVHYNSQQVNQNTAPDGKQKDTGVSYSQYYPGNIWSLGPPTNSKRIFFDKYGDFFFEFISSVRVEYLSGFDQLDLNSIIPTPTMSNLGEFLSIKNSVNINLSSYKWEQLTQQTFNSAAANKIVLCRLIDFIPAAFAFLDIPLISELKFYDKYYKYFLIRMGDTSEQLLDFGSTL